MKKYYVFFVYILILINTGCTRNTNLLENVKSINYKNIILLDDDMSDIKDLINSINFNTNSAIDVLKDDTSPLIIETENEKYEFVFVDSNICYKIHNDGSGSFLCGKDKKIESTLDNIFEQYTTENFSIRYDNNYTKDDGTIVKYEETNQSIIIDLNQKVKQISVYEAKLDNDGNVIPGDIIYEEDQRNGKIVIKIMPPETIPRMYIRIINNYGVSFVYIPIYNGKTGEINFYSPISK